MTSNARPLHTTLQPLASALVNKYHNILLHRALLMMGELPGNTTLPSMTGWSAETFLKVMENYRNLSTYHLSLMDESGDEDDMNIRALWLGREREASCGAELFADEDYKPHRLGLAEWTMRGLVEDGYLSGEYYRSVFGMDR